jgi:hypothetical protein
MYHADPLARNSFMAIIHLIANVHTFEHGALLLFPVSPPQTFLNFSLALRQYFVV